MDNLKIVLRKNLPLILTIIGFFVVNVAFGQDFFDDATETVEEGIKFTKLIFILVLFIGVIFIAWAFFTNNPKKVEYIIGAIVVIILFGIVAKYADKIV